MRTWLWAVAGCLVFMGCAWTAFWHAAALKFLQDYDRWVEMRRAEGYHITHDDLSPFGFPFAVKVSLSNLRLVAPQNAWEWRIERLDLATGPWAFQSLSFDAAGRHLILGLSQKTKLAMQFGGLKGQIAWHGRTLEHIDLQLSALRGGWPPDHHMALSGGRVRLKLRKVGHPRPASLEATQWVGPAPEYRLEGGLSLKNMTLSFLSDLPLGADIARLETNFSLDQITLHKSFESFTQSLAFWHARNGTLRLLEGTLFWGDLKMQSYGDLSLDGALRPLGRLDTRLQGFETLIDGFVQKGFMKPRQAAFAKIALGFQAETSPRDGRPVLRMPFLAHGGKISLGSVDLMTFPSLAALWNPQESSNGH